MALTATPAEQALLLDLQALDTKTQQIGHRLSKAPEIAALAALEAERETLRTALGEQTGSWEDARLELKRVESDVAVVEARVARDKERLQSTSSTKDVTALEQELAALASRQSDLEDIELAVMETVEQRETELGATQAALAELEERIGEAALARDAALGGLETERADAAADRETVAARIPADLLALYEKQRARYGVGASHLRGGVSSASGVALNSIDLSAVRAAAPDAVLLCPDSQAILVRTEESGL
jgi:predicted  nucleic acid-binding Zn-ribbon protein